MPILADALLRQYKFADVLDLIHPGDRDAALESRAALGTAAAGLRDQDTAAAMLRDPVRLDPSAVKPKIQLAQLLNAKDPAEADKLIDEAVAADPHSVEALQVKWGKTAGPIALSIPQAQVGFALGDGANFAVLFEGNAGQQLLFSNSGNTGQHRDRLE